jgi:predicted alpha/beta-fold hydrolase
MGDMEMAEASKKSLEKLHGPILYIVGDREDVAYGNAVIDYDRINKVPVAFANLLHGGHMGTFADQYGGSFSQMALKWLDWQLKDRKETANVFTKAQLSEFEGWTMKAKGF